MSAAGGQGKRECLLGQTPEALHRFRVVDPGVESLARLGRRLVADLGSDLSYGRVTQRLECHPYKVEVGWSSHPTPTSFKGPRNKNLRRPLFLGEGQDLADVVPAVAD